MNGGGGGGGGCGGGEGEGDRGCGTIVHTLRPQSKSRAAVSKRAQDRELKSGYKRPRGGKGSRFNYHPERDWQGREM